MDIDKNVSDKNGDQDNEQNKYFEDSGAEVEVEDPREEIEDENLMNPDFSEDAPAVYMAENTGEEEERGNQEVPDFFC